MVTNELLIQKIKEQVSEAEKLVNDPILFKEVIKRVELLCELVTENNSEQQTNEVTPEMLKPTNQSPSKKLGSDLSSDSIFDF